MVIQEAKDMCILKLEELLRSLMTHELKLNQLNEDEDEMKKKKFIALPAMIQRESDEDSEENIEISLIVRKVRNFMKKKIYYPRKKPLGRRERKKESEKGVCYECKKSGHLRFDYLQLKKELKKKKRAQVAT